MARSWLAAIVPLVVASCGPAETAFSVAEALGQPRRALAVRFAYLDGYVGSYEARVPVTPRLVVLIKAPWRVSFEVGTASAVACGSADSWDCM